MNRCLIFVFLAFFMISGCAGRFYRLEDDKVTFHLDLPAAQQVDFAYSLDGFRKHNIQKSQDGTWKITVPADIEFRYFFIVDGAVFLPDCDIREADDFGSENCIFEPTQ